MTNNTILNWTDHYNFLIFDQIDSTHTEAGRLAKSGVAEEFLVWAKQQTAGRGKIGREWTSPEGNLYFSFLLQRKIALSELSQVVFLVAVAIGEAIKPFLSQGDKLTYKWPNDLLLNGAKCGGILLESVIMPGSDSASCLVVSVGLNVLRAPEISTATKLWSSPEAAPPLDQLLSACVESFDYWYKLWRYMGFGVVREHWRKDAAHLGMAITLHEGNERISGIFSDIDAEGSLLLEMEGGTPRRIITGEIFGQQR